MAEDSPAPMAGTATLVTGSTGGTGGIGRATAVGLAVGGFWATRHVTADGLERTFAVDHLAGFLLAKVMITASRPFLKTPAQGAATSIYLSGRRHKRLAVLRPGRARRGAD